MQKTANDDTAEGIRRIYPTLSVSVVLVSKQSQNSRLQFKKTAINNKMDFTVQQADDSAMFTRLKIIISCKSTGPYICKTTGRYVLPIFNS